MTYTRVYDPITGLLSALLVVRDTDNAQIPQDPANSDFRAYLDWLAQGNQPAIMPAPPSNPTTLQSA